MATNDASEGGDARASAGDGENSIDNSAEATNNGSEGLVTAFAGFGNGSSENSAEATNNASEGGGARAFAWQVRGST